MTFKDLLKINAGLFFLYGISLYFAGKFELFSILKLILGALLIFLSGINAAACLKIVFKKETDFSEFLALSMLSVLIFYPTLLSIEFFLFDEVRIFFPLVNIFIIIPLLALLLKIKKTDLREIFFILPKKRINDLTIAPFFIVFVASLAIIAIIFSAYKFLPDKDPFAWVFKLSDLFDEGKLLPISYRPAFSGITYIFTCMMGIKIFSFFKYVVPMLFLSTLVPIWIFARRYRESRIQVLFLMTALITPNVILYSQTAMPQAFLIFLAYFFVFFLLISYQTRDIFYYYVAGMVSALGIFFHEVSAVFFIIWLLVTLFGLRKELFRQKKDFIFLVLLMISNISLFKVDFIYLWIIKILGYLRNPKINLIFPASYKNVDGNEMGWGSLFGVAKYYSYYIGPLVLCVLFVFCYNLILNKSFRKYSADKIFKNRELLIIFICFLVFFAISEIFPRIFGIALLPDRAWIFGGIFSVLFLFVIFEFRIKYENLTKISAVALADFLIFLIIIGIFGSLYINDQKKFLITSNELRSIEWINHNLPTERIFISATASQALRYFSKSKVINVSSQFYYTDDSIKRFTSKNMAIVNDSILAEYMIRVRENSDVMNTSFKNYSSGSDEKNRAFINIAKDNVNISKSLIQKINLSKISFQFELDNLYIYYSEQSKLDPYANRPYQDKLSIENNSIIFDKYPDKFRKIYEDAAGDRVIIWKVL